FFARHAEAYARAERFIARWGALSLIAARFFAPARGFVPLVAGATHLGRHRFLLATAAGALAWAAVLVEAGETVAAMFARLPEQWSIVLGAGLLAAWAVWAAARQ